MKKSTLAFIVFFSAATFTYAQQRAPQPRVDVTPSPPEIQVAGGAVKSKDDLALRMKAFQLVWQTVADKHYDATFGGVNWNDIRTIYEPRARATKTDAELYLLLQAMLGELRLSHFQIIPLEAATSNSTSDSPPTGKEIEGSANLDLRWLENRLVVTRVAPDSDASRAGIRRGFAVLKIDDTKIEDVRAALSQSMSSEDAMRFRLVQIILARMRGAIGTSVRLSVLDEAEREREITFKLEPPLGELAPAFGNFPALRTEFEARRLANGVGYIRFNLFVIPQMARIRAALREMADAPGIVFDVRGNPGGIGAMANGITGLLTKTEFSLGTMQMRHGHINFIAYPQNRPYTGKVVVLTDGMSASTSEIFAAGLQEAKRATVIGERTAGAALPSVIERLPTRALFQYAIADFKTPQGKLLEGNGVMPDKTVNLTRLSLLADKDLQLEAALAHINAEKTFSHE